jgi:DNA-binding MarR family transcriptional regulator
MSVDRATIGEFRAALRRFERHSQKHLRACCGQVSVAQCHVMLAIEAARQSTATTLARSLELDISTISRTVDGLVKRGLVARLDRAEDRRQIPLELTESGKRICTAINRDADRFCADVMAHLPQKRRTVILKDFATVVGAFALCQKSGSVPPACCDSSPKETPDRES